MIYITGDTHRDFSRLYNLKEIEDDYPNFIFAKDGETYNINGKVLL